MMIVNEKIGKIKLELLTEAFTKQIKDSYTLNLSMVLLEEFENLQQENTQLKENERLKEIENKLIFIKNRAKQGMSQENINKCAIKLINSYLKEN